VSIVMTDIASPELDHNAGLAMRCFGDHGTGVDFGYDFAAGVWGAYRVSGGERTPAITIAPESGDMVLGDAPQGRHRLQGTVSTPHQPAFEGRLARDRAAVTGDGTAAVVSFDEEALGRGGHFDPA